MQSPPDILVIGGSAGAVDALVRLMPALPARLPARLFIVVHIPAGVSTLPAILSRAGALPARHPVDGEETRPGVAYVAPPDRHLLVTPGAVRVTHGPRERGHRPAIDVLFRSAAESHGPRVVAVVLSGNLSDGAAGALAVHRAGGRVVVQDPADAPCPGMPAASLARVPHAAVLPLALIGAHLVSMLAAPNQTPCPAPSAEARGVLRTTLHTLEEGAELAARLRARAAARGRLRAADAFGTTAAAYERQAQAIRAQLRVPPRRRPAWEADGPPAC